MSIDFACLAIALSFLGQMYHVIDTLIEPKRFGEIVSPGRQNNNFQEKSRR